ncbi:MAG: SUMF1/EgtB/PvdO family nonheme iron enzyme, partial [Bacteroidetes bacterium]|nr:SUMF1/EgtB/PvdO family nonheme iron enzyme [Bacteroidota bacterium]
MNGIREFSRIRLSHTAKLGIAGTALFVAGCGQQDTGDVIGVQGRRVWFHPQPYGMVYVPSGTFHTGQADQDIFASYIQPNKQITITAFWMDETEITNNEYRQFVHFVIDSIARYMVDDDALFIEDEDGNRVINYDVELDWEKYREELEDMYYRESERFRGKKQIDTRKLYYVYQWYDMVMAANLDRDKYAPMDRSKFIKKEKTLIYPDTLAFVRDFTYSFNEPQARH